MYCLSCFYQCRAGRLPEGRDHRCLPRSIVFPRAHPRSTAQTLPRCTSYNPKRVCGGQARCLRPDVLAQRELRRRCPPPVLAQRELRRLASHQGAGCSTQAVSPHHMMVCPHHMSGEHSRRSAPLSHRGRPVHVKGTMSVKIAKS